MPLLSGPTTPTWQRHQALPPDRFRLFPFRSPLLRESLLLSIPRGTEMFQFPRFPPLALCVQARVTPHDGCRVSPFGHPRIKAWSAAPRGFSQPPTSFIGIRRQGIHRWLFVAWNTNTFQDARARYGILKGSQRPRLDGGAGSHGGRRRAASPPKVSRAAPPDNGTEVGPTPPPATERSKPAIGGVRGGLRRVIDSDVPPDLHPDGRRGGGTP